MRPIPRIQTHVDGLDDVIDGGVASGSSVVVVGPPGAYKTTLLMHILYNNAAIDQRPGLYVTLEQTAAEIQDDMEYIGYRLDEVADRLQFLDVAGLRLDYGDKERDWLVYLYEQLRSRLKEQPYQLLAIDSLSQVFDLPGKTVDRADLFRFFNNLKGLGITSFLVSEMSGDDYGRIGNEAYVGTGLIHLSTRYSDGRPERFLRVVKLRRSRHDQDDYPFVVERARFELVRS